MIDLKDTDNYPVLALMVFNLMMCVGLFIGGAIATICLVIFVIELLIGGISAILLIMNKILK